MSTHSKTNAARAAKDFAMAMVELRKARNAMLELGQSPGGLGNDEAIERADRFVRALNRADGESDRFEDAYGIYRRSLDA